MIIKKPIPIIIQAKIIQNVPLASKNVLILSDYQRPQPSLLLPKTNIYYLNYKNQDEIEKLIENSFEKETKVFLSHQTLWFPYDQYDGQQLFLIKGNRRKA